MSCALWVNVTTNGPLRFELNKMAKIPTARPLPQGHAKRGGMEWVANSGGLHLHAPFDRNEEADLK